MSENKTIILADDLTGANDTAIQFVKHGLKALVITHVEFPEPAIISGYDVLSLNSDSREIDKKAAYDSVGNLIKRLITFKLSGNYYKKVDSVLRGNPGSELNAVMDELGISLAIAAPSFPANRSTLEQGMLRSGALNISVDAVKLFASQMNKKVESLPLDKIRLGEKKAAEYVLGRRECGVEVFVADAVTDEDLAIIWRLSAALSHPHVLAGSAGLANHIAKNIIGGNDLPPPKRPIPGGTKNFPVLLAAGTRQGETTAQITALSKHFSVPVILFKTEFGLNGRGGEAASLLYEEASKHMENGHELCVVALDVLFETGISKGDVIRDNNATILPALISFAEAIEALVKSFKFPVMINTGGDTSLEICKRIGIAAIQPLAEICPGIPIGRIVGGEYENRYMVTKSGRFGNNNTLIEILDYLGAE